MESNCWLQKRANLKILCSENLRHSARDIRDVFNSRTPGIEPSGGALRVTTSMYLRRSSSKSCALADQYINNSQLGWLCDPAVQVSKVREAHSVLRVGAIQRKGCFCLREACIAKLFSQS